MATWSPNGRAMVPTDIPATARMPFYGDFFLSVTKNQVIFYPVSGSTVCRTGEAVRLFSIGIHCMHRGFIEIFVSVHVRGPVFTTGTLGAIYWVLEVGRQTDRIKPTRN